MAPVASNGGTPVFDAVVLAPFPTPPWVVVVDVRHCVISTKKTIIMLQAGYGGGRDMPMHSPQLE
jgi:hypothetical protein